MATSVQGSASSIGMAPATAAAPAAGQGAGLLPDLTGGAAQAGTAPGAGAGTGVATGGAGTDPAAAGQQAAAPTALAPAGLLKHGAWLGPLATIGGGAMALKGFQAGAVATAANAATKGGGLLRWGGIAAALGGIGLTALGFKARGVEAGTKATEQQALAAMQQLQVQYQQTMEGLSQQASAEIGTLKQQLAQAQAGAGQGAPGQGSTTESGQGVGVGPGLDTTVVPGSQAGAGAGSTAPVGPGAGSGTQATQAAQGTTPAGPWSAQQLLGTTVDLTAGASAAGTPIAEAGTFRIEGVAGDANGYATLDEANAAARSTMSTELMGSRFLRWMVVEHGGRFYGVVAKQAGEGSQPNPLQPQQGNVVAWSAMNHVSENGVNGFQAYSWSQATGAQSIPVPYGTTNVFESAVTGGGPVGPGATGAAPSGTGAAPGTIDAAIAAVTGGGPVTPGGQRAAFDPASQVGRSFSINASTTAEGDLVRGGALQVQRFVETSAGGFGTAEEAAVAARQAREAAGGGDQWTRWLTLQGNDGRFYVYQGSIVKRPTAELEAAPVHVFGAGVAQFFDGTSSSWRAIRDQRAAAAS